MQYLFEAKRAIPELGVSPGDLVVMSPAYGVAAVTVLKEHGDDAVALLLDNLDSLRPLPAPLGHGVLSGRQPPVPLERCLDPGRPDSGDAATRSLEHRRRDSGRTLGGGEP